MKVGDETYEMTHPACSEALIDEADFERDERLPYWADLWPSAIALARRVCTLDLAGKRVVELGCGVGLPTVVALGRGAEALATDHYRAALDFTVHNAAANVRHRPRAELLDWHAPQLDGLGTFDLVLAADVLYEKRNVSALARLIPELLAPGGEVLLADPRRKEAPSFLEKMEGRGFRVSTERFEVEQGGRDVTVLVHRIRR